MFKCNNCSKELQVMHEDVLECSDCGGKIIISYCACTNCGFTCRLNNGKFLDGVVITVDADDELYKDLEEALGFEGGSTSGPMINTLTPCVRCGSKKAYESKPGEYECPECGFSWELVV